MNEGWYFKQLGQEFGPFSLAQLRDLVIRSQLLPTDAVRQGRSGPFQPLETIPEIDCIVKAEPKAPQTESSTPPDIRPTLHPVSVDRAFQSLNPIPPQAQPADTQRAFSQVLLGGGGRFGILILILLMGGWVSYPHLGGLLSDRVATPLLPPKQLAANAMAQYDANRDGKISGEELGGPMQCLLETADQNADGVLQMQEIAQRLQFHKDSQLGLVSILGTVQLNRQPLSHATIVFEPEHWFEGRLSQATGRTASDGTFEMQTANGQLPGVQPGFYRVRISKKDVQGNERLPAKYNVETELGIEIGINMESDVHFNLSK